MRGRVAIVGAGLAALIAGLLVGTAACNSCDEYVPFANGTYGIVASDDRPELVGATVEISDETVEISFTDAEGNPWVVRYAIESRNP